MEPNGVMADNARSIEPRVRRYRPYSQADMNLSSWWSREALF
jgi:hypothetical protein